MTSNKKVNKPSPSASTEAPAKSNDAGQQDSASTTDTQREPSTRIDAKGLAKTSAVPGNDARNKGSTGKGAPSHAVTSETPTRVTLQGIVGKAEESFGKGSVMLLGEGPSQDIAAIPTGSFSLDRALGIGGYPVGRIVEIFGPESSGKTTLTLHAIAQVQRVGGAAAFIDAEHAFDSRYAKAIGVDTGALLVAQPDNGEQALEIAEFLTKTGHLDLVVIDSVAALTPRAEIEGDMGDAHMGLQARLMSQALRKLTAVSNKEQTTFIFINQLRQKIGVVFGNPETTTGGNALKFFSSVRLDVRRVGKVTAGETVVGNRTRVKVIKNKCAQPFTEAEFDIRWGVGIDRESDLLELASELGIVEKRGAHYALGDVAIGHGKEKARQAIYETPSLAKELEERLIAAQTAARHAA